MKKNILIALLLIGSTTALLTSCSKDDTTGPAVTLIGSSSIEISLNSGAWTDLGATATDDEDGTVTVSSDASTTNPNTNLVGTYTVTYTSTDAAGNVGTTIRTIRVKNDAEIFAGSFNVHDTVPGVLFTYTQNVTVHTSINKRVNFNLFANYANNTAIYATMLPNGDLEIPLQAATSIGSGAGTCDIANHNFSSITFLSTSNGFVMGYRDAITSPGSCVGSTDGVATFTRQ